jgi:pyruvate formate lyase activating enzyme
MQITSYLKTSWIDYPEILSSVVYTPNCNFKCQYCHNKDLMVGRSLIDQEDIIQHLIKRKGIIEGVVISGGEPTLQKGLLAFVKRIKSMGLRVKLDTNGSNPSVLKELIELELLDYVAMDLKGILSMYPEITQSNVSLEAIKESIDIIKSSQIEYEFRTTLMKEFHNENKIIDIMSFVNGAKKIYLQQYSYSNKQVRDIKFEAYTLEEMYTFKKRIQKELSIKEIHVRGKY